MRELVLATIFFVFTVSASPAQNESSILENLKQIVSDVEINANGLDPQKNNNSLEEVIALFAKSHDVSFELPFGSKLTMDARNFDLDELNLKLNFGSGSEVQARKKSRLRKALVPILIFIFIKAIILIPLALGVLGLKTWNAMQLSFVSFVTAAALAIWKLCSKVHHDQPPALVHHPWEPPHYYDRSDMAQQMAYSDYAPAQ